MKYEKIDTNYVWYADLKKSKNELSKISSSFCLAKWLQVTLHLHKGMTHSCHHPKTHQITLEDIKDNPSGLHNTKEKLAERQEMLKGNQPKPCEYCWHVENASPDAVSDRIMKSASDWAFPYANEVVESGLGSRINPRYLEVSFSNVCNFKCSYCSADYSTKWQQEIEALGSFTSRAGEISSPIISEENNPYIETFWSWWPSLKKDLHVFRITGGEPLLSKNTWRILDDLEINPAPNLQIAINSNLGVPTDLIKKLIEKLNSLLTNKKVGDVRVFTSIDGLGADAELIRNGLDANLFFMHVEMLLKGIPSMRIVIMATYSALSVYTYTDLLKKIFALRKIYFHKGRLQPLGISTSYLRYPEHLSVKVLDESLVNYPESSLEYMKQNMLHPVECPTGFTEYEVNAMSNLISWFKSPIKEDKKKFLQDQFTTFYKEHDERRNTISTESISKIKTWV